MRYHVTVYYGSKHVDMYEGSSSIVAERTLDRTLRLLNVVQATAMVSYCNNESYGRFQIVRGEQSNILVDANKVGRQ